MPVTATSGSRRASGLPCFRLSVGMRQTQNSSVILSVAKDLARGTDPALVTRLTQGTLVPPARSFAALRMTEKLKGTRRYTQAKNAVGVASPTSKNAQVDLMNTSGRSAQPPAALFRLTALAGQQFLEAKTRLLQPPHLRFEFHDFARHDLPPAGRHRRHFAARPFRPEQLLDFSQPEACLFGETDEAQAVHHVRRVPALAGRPGGRRKQPHALIITQCRRPHADTTGDLADGQENRGFRRHKKPLT